MATSQLLKTDTLGDFTEVQPKHLRVCGNHRKGIISVRTGFFASRDAKFCIPEIIVISVRDHPYFNGLAEEELVKDYRRHTM